MASRPPRFFRRFARQPQAPDPTAGQAAAALAAELEGFSARLNERLDRTAAEQGFQAGVEAGTAGEPISGSTFSIRGRAFNEGAIVAHQAALQTDIRDSLDRFELEHPDDPEAFDARAEGLVNGLLEEADPRLQPFIRQRAADYSGRAKTRILGRQADKLHAQAVADLDRGAEGFLDDATTAAFEGDIGLLEARRQELDELLVRGVAGELIEEGAAAEFKIRFEREVTASEVIGNFDRTVREQGLDAGLAAIRRWQDTDPSDLGLTAEDHEAVTRQMITLHNREQALQADTAAKSSAALQAQHRLREGRVKDAIEVLRKGFPVDREQAKQVIDDIAWLRSTGDVDDRVQAELLARDFDTANAIQATVHQFRRLPTPARAAQLGELEATLRTGGAAADQLELLESLQAADAEVTRELEADPRGFLRREALIEDAPLNFESAEGLIESLAGRATDVGTQLTGGQPVPKLTAAEADQVAGLYESAELEERVSLLGILTAGSGPEALATLEQLDDKGHKNMALLGSFILDGRAALARDVMRGQLVLGADKGIKPKRADYQAIVDDTWQAALGLPMHAEQRALHLEAAFAKYAELKSRTGDLSDVFEPELFEQSLETLMPTGEFNGRRVALPAGVPEAAFEDWHDAWKPEDFAGVAGADPAELLSLVRSDGILVELGHGRYGVSLASAASGDPRFLVREDGEPFVLSFPRGE